jgi:hypothetical protein
MPPRMAARLRAIDAWVLLRHPRVWAARAHVVLPIAALVYAALALLVPLLLRPLLTPSPGLFISGAQSYRGAWDAGLARQFQTSLVFTLTRNATSNEIGLVVLAVCGAAFVAGVVCLVFWLRQVSGMPTVIDVANPPTKVWAEWLLYALCVAAFLGAPIWIFTLLNPTAVQRTAVDEVLSASRDALIARATSSGVDPGVYLFQSNNNQPLSRIYDAGERLVGMAFFDLGQDLVVPRRLRFTPTIDTRPAGTGQMQVSWVLDPRLNQAERDYLVQLADATYARAFLEPAPAHRVVRLIYAELLFWWLVGVTAFWVFATRRAPPRHIAGAAFGAAVISALISFTPAPLRFPGAAFFAAGCALACARALRGGVFRSVWFTGVVCGPPVLALIALLIAHSISARAPIDVFNVLLSYRPWQYTAVPVLALAALAYLPLLPVFDRALTRLSALPRA